MMAQNALVSGKARRLADVFYEQVLTTLNRRWPLNMPILASVAMMLISNSAFAQTVGGTTLTTGTTGGSQATQMLLNVCNFILGPFGQTIAVLGIIGIGMAWMFGRASLGMIAGVIGGIIIMFGASFLGQMLTAA